MEGAGKWGCIRPVKSEVGMEVRENNSFHKPWCFDDIEAIDLTIDLIILGNYIG